MIFIQNKKHEMAVLITIIKKKMIFIQNEKHEKAVGVVAVVSRP